MAPPGWYATNTLYLSANNYGWVTGLTPAQVSRPPGIQICNGRFTYTAFDNHNCGGCDIQCNAGEDCCYGGCIPRHTPDNCANCHVCQQGQGCCFSEMAQWWLCTQLGSSQNCLDCGDVCDPGDTCCAPQGCVRLGTSVACRDCQDVCSAGEGCCYNDAIKGMECTPLNTDENCGQCGRSITSGEACCNGVPTLVVNDNANCGACGHVCTGGKHCVNSTCVCPPGMVDCSGVCTTLGTDQNCAHCGDRCTLGRHCVNGVCQCPDGTTNLQTNLNNCGICGRICGSITVEAGTGTVVYTDHQQCMNGHCVCGANEFQNGEVIPGVPWCIPVGSEICSAALVCTPGRGHCCTRNDGTPGCC